MKAVICTKYGGPEVLQVREVAKPAPKDDEILVKIIATTVNSGDVRVRALAVGGFMKVIMRIVLGVFKPRKPILGTVYAGVVESAGNKVTEFKQGDKVFGMTGFKFGTYAQYLAVKQNSNIAFMPNNAAYEEAASLIFGGQTAIYFLEKAGMSKIKKPKVLIIGSTGAVGSAAVQIAKYYNAEVTAVCGTSGVELTQRLGATDIVVYDKQDFTTLNTKFDIIFDAVGKSSKRECAKLLADAGVFKTVGGLEVASETRQQLEFMKELFESGKLKAIIDKTFTLDEVVEAHRYVDTGRKKGNVVLQISD